MKTLIKTLGLIGMLSLVLLFMGQARAQDDNNVSFQTFYDQLGSQGTWIQTNDYGYVWQPSVNDSNWRPYTDGQWANTDAGWTWVSNEPWGWATYHYGRWVNLDGEGWVWVPGYTWAPAWVSWRYNDDYCGWAPLPPDTCLGIDYFGLGFGFGFGFHIGDDCDLAYGIGPAWYNFCPVAFFGDRDWRNHIVNCNDNFRIINQTRNVTNINVRNGRVRADGPSLAAVNARAHTPFHQVALTRADRPDAAGLHGNSLAVYSPRIDPKSANGARPRSVAQSLNNARINRGTDINRPMMVNSHVSPAGPTGEQVQAARQAQADAPRNARVATNATRPSRALTQPLTSFHPITAAHNNATPGTTGVNGNSTAGTVHNGAGAAPVNGRTASSERYNTPSSTHAQGAVTAQRHDTAASGTGANRTAPAQAAVPHHNYAYQGGASHYAAPTHHDSSGGGYRPTSSYHPASSFHSSAPAYHPQSSFHPSASVSHFSGGGAPHASSGGGGGRPSGGGGGGGHSGGNGNGNGRH